MVTAGKRKTEWENETSASANDPTTAAYMKEETLNRHLWGEGTSQGSPFDIPYIYCI